MKIFFTLSLILFTSATTGCATLGDASKGTDGGVNAIAAVANSGVPQDPFESYNRVIYAFNERFDRAIAILAMSASPAPLTK